MLSPVFRAAHLLSLPNPAADVVEVLSFDEYTAGSDPLVVAPGEELCVLELTHELGLFFEQEFCAALIQQGLVALRPVVLLYRVEATAAEDARDDYPFLTPQDVDRLADWCARRQYPHRKGVLETLLESVVL